MVKIKAFKGLRPQPELAVRIASLPYDVIDSNEARQLAAGNPYSYLHVVKSEIDLAPEVDHYAEKVYLKAAENLQQMCAQGWLGQDNQPSFYIYRQRMDQHVQTGLVVTAHIRDYLDQKIRIHELTRAKKEQDRINHVRYTQANTEPVFLTYLARKEIDTIIGDFCTNQPPVYDFLADDKIQHTVWIIADQTLIHKLTILFEQIPYAYVADGHHRTKSAVMVGEQLRQENVKHTGSEEYNWFLAVYFPHDQLQILPYNRVVKDLNGLTSAEFLHKVAEKFKIQPVADRRPAEPQRKHQFGLYLDHKWYAMEARTGTFNANDPEAALDVAILQTNLLAPILNIGDPRTDERIDFVGGIRGLAELERRVNSGEMAIAFALYPTQIDQLFAIADAGKIMPPKSTWFEPKLRSGLLIHLLK